MVSDMHVHTSFSSDSFTPPEAQIERAIEMGMKHICITDHQDYYYPPAQYNFLIGGDGNLEPYISKLEDLKEKYKGKIEVLTGIEFGLQPFLCAKYDEVYKQYPFDLVIGSTHVFDGHDTEDIELYEFRERKESILDYFETEYRNLKRTNGYDVVGHMDFILRDVPGKNNEFSILDYYDILDEIVQLLIRKDKAIEINTKSLAVGMQDVSPSVMILGRYKKLGGKLITFGSDAHVPEAVGREFQIASDILEVIGFDQYCIFRNHEPVFLPLANR